MKKCGPCDERQGSSGCSIENKYQETVQVSYSKPGMSNLFYIIGDIQPALILSKLKEWNYMTDI